MSDIIDVQRITRALREYRAADNSAMRALAELTEAIPEGVLVLHKLPGEPDGPATIYWTYQRQEAGISYGAGRGRDDAGMRAVIVEAPRPREEFLPRLPQ